MWGLLLKDLLNMRKYLKTLGVIVGVMLVMGLCMGEASFVAGIGAMLSDRKSVV